MGRIETKAYANRSERVLDAATKSNPANLEAYDPERMRGETEWPPAPATNGYWCRMAEPKS